MVNRRNILSILFILLILNGSPSKVFAYGECNEYGTMVTYDSYSHTCKCMSGYIFSSKYGSTQCVSADSVCWDKYGYSSRYNSLSDSCECSFGHVFGKDSIGRTQCVTPDSICENQLGYNSEYDSIYDTCKCRYGYFIKNGQCVHGTNTCRATHGLYSSFNNSISRCECDDGYTLDDASQCVKKQNNVYFTLKELDTSEKKAIIRSDYDYRYYLISYGYGCYATSFNRYLNHQIVVNLGTDFDLDTWDKIVLQDDDETCDITHKEYADSDTTLVPQKEPSYYYIPEPITPSPSPEVPDISKPEQAPIVVKSPEIPNIDESKIVISDKEIKARLKVAGTLRKCPSIFCGVERYYAETSNVQIIGNYNNKEWFKIRAKDDNGKNLEGWMHNSILEIIVEIEKPTVTIPATSTKTIKSNANDSWLIKLWKFIFGN